MSNVVGDIAIQVGADIGPLVRELGKASGAVSKFGKDAQASGGGMVLASKAGVALGAAVLTAGAAMATFTRAAMNNIDALSKQARLAGVAVSTFQAMALVAEEAGVSSEALSKSLVKMQDNITSLGRGGKAQIAAFDQLGLSFAQIGTLSADAQFELIAERISAITDPALRTSAALDVFGKSGADAIGMMSGYGAAVANAAAFQEQFGLAVSDVDAANIEAANDALGRSTMAIQSLGTQLAVTFAPGIEAVALGLAALVHDVLGVETALDNVFGSGEIAKAILGEEMYNQLNKDAQAFASVASEVGQLQGVLQATSGIAENAAIAFGQTAQSLSQIGAGDVAAGFYELSTSIEQANSDFAAGVITAEQYREKLQLARDRAAELVAEASKISGVDMSGVTGQVAALGVALAAAAAKALSLRAAMSSTGAAGVGAGASATANVNLRSGLAPRTSPRPLEAPESVDFGVDLGAGTGDGDGGGGGGADPMQAKTDALIESLKTQSEIVNEWYIASQEALQLASDAELAIIGGRQAAIERLEEEHQARLSGIKDAGNQFSVQSALDGGALILGAMASTNKKAAKAQAIFAAGSALISAYQGAAKELEKGTFGFASAAAVIAKGIAFVSAIKSAGSSASGGGGGGGSVSGAGAPAASGGGSNPLEVNLNTYGAGDFMAKMDVASLLSRLNDEAGDRGYRIMVPA